MTVPAQKPGRSEQIVCTPKDFIESVENRFGLLEWDTAATCENSVVRGHLPLSYFGPDHENEYNRDGLTASWDAGCLHWCNPPFDNIKAWTAKAALNPQARVLMLLPASIGSEWFAKCVHGKAYVLALRKRLTFVGHKHAYPKDLMLAVYGFGLTGFEVWDWSKKVEAA